MRPRLIAIGLSLVLLASCASPQMASTSSQDARRNQPPRNFSASDVVRWARLKSHFIDRTAPLEVGTADGRAVLGQRVLLLNGEEARAFLREHGARSVSGPIAVRSLGAVLEVEVELTGEDGSRLRLQLSSDGTRQGEG